MVSLPDIFFASTVKNLNIPLQACLRAAGPTPRAALSNHTFCHPVVVAWLVLQRTFCFSEPLLDSVVVFFFPVALLMRQ